MKKYNFHLIISLFLTLFLSNSKAVFSTENLPAIYFPELLKVNDTVYPLASLTGLNEELLNYNIVLSIINEADTIYRSNVSEYNISVNDTVLVSFESWIAFLGEFELRFEILPLNTSEIEAYITTMNFKVINGVNRKLVVLEEGTGTACVFCPAAANGLEDLLTYGHNVAIVAYHTADIYQTDESWYRAHDYYHMAAFPCVKFDGIQEVVGGGLSFETMYPEYAPIVDERLTVPTPIDINIEVQNADASKGYFGAYVTLTKYDFVEGPLVLQAVLTETHIYDPWENLSYVNHVERKMFPNQFGTELYFANQNDTTIPLFFTIDEGWELENCEVVFFVQNYETKEIYNGEKIMVTNVDPAKVTFNISDNSEFPISNVLINVNSEIIETDVNGIAETRVIPGNYIYTLKKDGYYPYFGAFSIYMDDIGIEVALDIANILLEEDFSNNQTVDEWSVLGLGQSNWTISNTSFANGNSPELIFNATPTFEGNSSFVSPLVNTSNISKLLLKFKYSLDYDYGGYEIMIETTQDGINWNTVWNPEITADINSDELELIIDNNDIGSETFQFAFTFEGNSFDIGSWAIDDVFLIETLELFDVRFNVDLSFDNDFNPDLDSIFLSGNFDGDYIEPGLPGSFLMQSENEENIYSSTIQLLPGTYTYKYFKNSGWDGSEPGNARIINITNDTIINDRWGILNPVIEEYSDFSLTVFPNPFSNYLNIELNKQIEDRVTINIYNISGALVYNQQLENKQQIKVDCSAWDSGLYVVKIVSARFSVTKKICLVK